MQAKAKIMDHEYPDNYDEMSFEIRELTEQRDALQGLLSGDEFDQAIHGRIKQLDDDIEWRKAFLSGGEVWQRCVKAMLGR